jgi:nucleoside-diphosphate-sugar epimerase
MSARPVTIVTGGSGWLGHALVRALAEADRSLRCLVPDDAAGAAVQQTAPGAELVVGDVRDPAAVARLFDGMPGSVFHCAGVIHPPGRTRDFYDVNAGGTALVVDEARRSGAGRLIYVSSNSPFGYRRSPSEVFDEDAPYNPHLGYGGSKMEAERTVLNAKDLDTVVIRAPWFYGPAQPERQTRFFKAIRRGRFPLFGDGTNRRSLVYTDNLVQGLLLAERTPGIAGRAYWIADAEPKTMAEVHEAVRAALIAEGLEVTGKQRRLPGIMCEVAGWVDTAAQRAGRYVQPVHVLSEMNKTIACTIERARAELGYEPTVDLLEGMRRSVRWCIDAGVSL